MTSPAASYMQESEIKSPGASINEDSIKSITSKTRDNRGSAFVPTSKMASSIPTQIAETVQSAHIKRHPSPTHDLNPSTAASAKEPVTLHRKSGHDDLDSADEEDDIDDIPYSVLRPRRRSTNLPPMPDLRFEQSYLNSISKTESWGMIAWITARDQVMMPLIQGVVYNLFLLGWQSWNRNARVHGNSIGARARRWWYGVNNWALPGDNTRTATGRLRKEL